MYFMVFACSASVVAHGYRLAGVRGFSVQLKENNKKYVLTFSNTNLGFDARRGTWTRPQIDILVASCGV